jgi:hypothetical protein
VGYNSLKSLYLTNVYPNKNKNNKKKKKKKNNNNNNNKVKSKPLELYELAGKKLKKIRLLSLKYFCLDKCIMDQHFDLEVVGTSSMKKT